MSSVTGHGADGGGLELPEGLSGTPTVWGDIRFRADAALKANVHGNVEATHKLVLAAEGEVTGWVKAGNLCVEGKISGGAEAAGRVWIKTGAVLRQRCFAGSLRIEPGADFQGELRVGEVSP